MPSSDEPRSGKPCIHCKTSKVKCSYTSPCTRCVRKSIECVYPINTEGRIRRYHKRSTAGCVCCKNRHVRCDEQRPTCGNCLVRAEDCVYPAAAAKAMLPRSRTRSTSPRSVHSLSASQSRSHSTPGLQSASNPNSTTLPRKRHILPTDDFNASNSKRRNTTTTTTSSATIPTPEEPFDLVPFGSTPFPPGLDCMPIAGPSTSTSISFSRAAHGYRPYSHEGRSGDLTDFRGDDSGSMQVYGTGSGMPQIEGSGASERNSRLSYRNGHNLDTQDDTDGRFALLNDEEGNDSSPTQSEQRIGMDMEIAGEGSGMGLLPVLSRNLFNNTSRTIDIGTSSAYYYNLPQPGPSASTFAQSPVPMGMGTGTRQSRTAHQAWMKSLWMAGDLLRMPKMPRVIDVDNLEGFFPNTEQRHQFKHFTTHTCNIILTIPTTPTLNPWLNLFVPLALSYPHGTSLTCDALRLGILSLAAFDIGFRMARAQDDKVGGTGIKEAGNAMYELSRHQRGKALELLKIAKIAGHLEEDKAGEVEVDMTLGAVLMLSIRDRLAGATEWMDPMDLAVRLVLSMGGPNAFLNKRYSQERKFILEQSVCVEIIACLTVLTPTRLLSRDQAWFKSPLRADETGHDHIELVYGLDRDTLAYIAEGLLLSDIKRSVESLRIKTKEMRGYPEFHKALLSKEFEMETFGQGLLEKVGVLRMSTLMTPHATRVVVGNLLFQSFMELWILAEIVEDPFNSPRVQGAVENIFEIVAEAMSRGMYSGFLLPCSWAATLASSKESRERSRRILDLLKPGYHLDYDLTHRLIQTIYDKWDLDDGKNWTNLGPATGNSLLMGKEHGGQLMDYENWEKFLKQEGLYVPFF